MQNFNYVLPENPFHLIHRVKQINVLCLPRQPPILILLINLYNRTSIISFFSNGKKVFVDFNPNCEILKIKLTNLKSCDSMLHTIKNEALILILTPYTLILYSVFLRKKIRELTFDNCIVSHKYSFDDFFVIPLEDENYGESPLKSKSSNTKSPKFLVATSSNDCTIKIWNLLSGCLLRQFSSTNMNKNFVFIPPSETHQSALASVFNAKIFNQTKLEINIWDWRRGELIKTIKNALNIRSVLQIECKNMETKSFSNGGTYNQGFHQHKGDNQDKSDPQNKDHHKIVSTFKIGIENKQKTDTQYKIGIKLENKNLEKVSENINDTKNNGNTEKENFLIIGGVENTPTYKIFFLDWRMECVVKKIENLCCFSFFVLRTVFGKENTKEEEVIVFNKYSVSVWNETGQRKKIVEECQDDFFNFTSGVEVGLNKKRKVIFIAKGLNVCGYSP